MRSEDARMDEMDEAAVIVSVGWQCASWIGRCHGNEDDGYSL